MTPTLFSLHIAVDWLKDVKRIIYMVKTMFSTLHIGVSRVSTFNMFTSPASGNRLYPHHIPVNLNITIEWSFPKIEVPQSSISKGLCMINHPTIGVP